MGILSWILLGLIAGAIAKFLSPTEGASGWILTLILGIVGAIVGGWIGSLFGWGTVNEFSLRTLLLSIGGAVLVLWLYGKIKK